MSENQGTPKTVVKTKSGKIVKPVRAGNLNVKTIEKK